MEISAHLPQDMLMEVFSRLPASSIGRFRTLSKPCYLMLSKPSFIKNHLNHSTKFKLILHINEFDFSPSCSCRYHILSYPLHNDFDMSEVNCLFDEFVCPLNPPSFLGSCNGLFCYIDWKPRVLTLWNPTTKEYDCVQKLPETKFNFFREKLHYNYSFGYDELNDDYKIVFLVCFVCDPEHEYWSQTSLLKVIYVYSHRRRCWKEIEKPFNPCYMQYSERDNCQFVHGKVHWVGYTSLVEEGIKHSPLIVSLDLAMEKYGTVPRPRPPSDHLVDELNICVLGGELCFYIHSRYLNGRGFEIWMMREYGVEQSWFKLYTIPVHQLSHIYFNKHLVPLFMMKSGEILLKALEMYEEESIDLYNPKNDSSIRVHRVNYNACLKGHIYVESLVETTIGNKGQRFLALA